MKKVWLGLATILGGLVLAPGVMAAGPEVGQRELGSVENITNSDTLTGGDVSVTIDPSELDMQRRSGTVTITYNSANLKLLGDGANNRPTGYAWLGIRVSDPTDLADCGNVTYKFNNEQFQKVEWDSDHGGMCSVDLYTGVNKADLLNAAQAGQKVFELGRYTFDWHADAETGEQTFIILVNVEGINLADENGTSIFSTEEAKDLIAAAQANQNAGGGTSGTAGNNGLDNPDTADKIVAYVTIAAMAAIGLTVLAVVVVTSNRHHRKNRKN